MMVNRSSTKFSIRFLLLTLLIFSIIGAAVYFHFAWQVKRTEIHFDEGWYKSFVLKNGMEVIVIPNSKIPAVTHMVWYKVGSIDELRGKSGVAHFLEHLMFKGTKKYRAGSFSEIVALNGGKENAMTAHDYTAYFQTISKDKLPLVMELEADRMKNLILREEDIEKELQVIIEERRMRTDNNPRALLMEQINAALYQNHPYGVPVIGWMHEMEGLTREDAIEHYKNYYKPNNAILVIAGDVTSAEVEKLAKKYYGKIKAQKGPARLELAEPPQRAARRIDMVDARVTEPELWRYYMAPAFNYDKSEHYYPLTVLSKIMGEGTLSRLYKKLVIEQKIATMVGTNYTGMTKGPGEFSFYALPANNASISDIEKAIDAEILNVIKNGVTDEEIESAKKSMVADKIYEQEGFKSLAFIVGELAVKGASPDYVTTWPDEVNSVTHQQIQDAATYVLQSKNSVTGVLRNGK